MLDMYTADTPTARLPAGTRLNGIFEIDHRFAEGGMGEIYRGHMIETGDPVAIKVMRTDLADNESALALFRKEAAALHHIHHEAIIRYYIFSSDPDIGRYYLATEFVDGQPLQDVLRDGPLPFETVRRLQQRVAAGLHAAHQHGIIHRDVSPDNILIPAGDVGRAKIIDFGIARSIRPGDGTVIGGGFAGKYNYVSPEQLGLFGGDVTARSDIYSFGLVLAECLAGRPLDMSGSQLEVIDKRRKVPDLDQIDPRYRPLLAQMLQPEPKDRPASMAEIAAWHPRPDARAMRAAADRDRAAKLRHPGGAGSRSRMAAIGAAAILAMVVVAGLGSVVLYLLRQSGYQIPLLTTASPSPSLPQAPPLASAQPPAPGTARTEPAGDARPRLVRFITAYDGGDCFYVTPVTVTETSATIDGYGISIVPFEVFRYDFKQVSGFEAALDLLRITPSQCAAATFLSRLGSRPGPSPRLDISAAKVRSGGVLSGSIADVGSRHLDLLLVSDDGLVYNMTGRLAVTGATRTFKIGLQLVNAGQPQPQLIIAVASSRPLEAFASGAAGASLGGASQVFSRALTEAQRPGQDLAASARYFTLEN